MRVLRVLILIVVGMGLMEPYWTHGTIGGGDAVKYSNAVSDFVTQIRAGIYPVWIGQSGFAFYGGGFPPRFSPVLPHEVALVDLFTGRTLPPFESLNIALTLSFVAGLLSCYFCLAAIVPARPWLATALAILYGACPGVIGLAYAQDLYMSASTLPFVPIVFLGMIRSFERDDIGPRLVLAGGLAATWLTHPPIALWAAFVACVILGARIFQRPYNRKGLCLDLLTIAAFFVLAGYSFVAAASVSAQWWMPAVSASDVVWQVKNAFPGNWLPVLRSVPLENLQLGYGLAGVFLLSVPGLLMRKCDLSRLALALITGILLCLIIPIPWVTGPLWHLVPGPIRIVTNIWPTQRLIVILALCVVFSGALAMREIAVSRVANVFVGAVVLASIAWSGFQCRLLLMNAARGAPTVAETKWRNNSENRTICAYIYGVRTEPPRYDSASVLDPELEHHFLDLTSHRLLSSVTDSIEPGFGPGSKNNGRRLDKSFSGVVDANPGVLDLLPKLRLELGKRYLLAMQFLDRDYQGVLIIHGQEFNRIYGLPLSGGPWAFGSKTECSRIVPLWTSLDHAIDVQLQFVPTGDGCAIG